MTPEQFCYWLQGFAEITGANQPPTAEQWKVINDHLQAVFKKVTPPRQEVKQEEIDWKKLKHDFEKRDKIESPLNPPYEVTCSTVC